MLITLYSTQGCHLCEQAFSLLVEAGLQDKINVVDIAFDDVLFNRYGITIPVLSIQNHDQTIPELNWPFDQEMLASWLTTYKLN